MATKVTKSTPEADKYDSHYKGEVEPIQLMKAQMNFEAYTGFLRGNIIKYASRFGKKDACIKEATKIMFYAEKLREAIAEHNG